MTHHNLLLALASVKTELELRVINKGAMLECRMARRDPCDEAISSVENVLKRDIVYSAANRLGGLPEFAEMPRTTAMLLAVRFKSYEHTHLSHKMVTMRWLGPSIFASFVAATPAQIRFAHHR